MATSPNVASRDDDPAHPNFDGIVFYPTTDRGGIVATPVSGQRTPPVSYLPLVSAMDAAVRIGETIDGIRKADRDSYLADYLDTILTDLADAIELCRPEATDGQG
jgi:hypothetical protein